MRTHCSIEQTRNAFKCIVLVARDRKRSGPTVGLGRYVSGLMVERIGDFELPGRRRLAVCASIVVVKLHEYVWRFVDIARGLGNVFLVLFGHLYGQCRRSVGSRRNI